MSDDKQQISLAGASKWRVWQFTPAVDMTFAEVIELLKFIRPEYHTHDGSNIPEQLKRHFTEVRE